MRATKSKKVRSFFTIKEYAGLCGVGIGTIKNRIAKGYISTSLKTLEYDIEVEVVDIRKYPPTRLKAPKTYKEQEVLKTKPVVSKSKPKSKASKALV